MANKFQKRLLAAAMIQIKSVEEFHNMTYLEYRDDVKCEDHEIVFLKPVMAHLKKDEYINAMVGRCSKCGHVYYR